MTEYWQLSLIKHNLGEAEGFCNSLMPWIILSPLDHVISLRHAKQVVDPYDEETCEYWWSGERRSYLFTAQSSYTLPAIVLWSFSLSWHLFQYQFHFSYYGKVVQNNRGDRILAGLVWSRLHHPPPQLEVLVISPNLSVHIYSMEDCCAPSGQVTARGPWSLLTLLNLCLILILLHPSISCCINCPSSLLK